MLDNKHQVAAYKLLQSTPIKTAVSVSQAASIETTAKAKATSLTALKVATITYPATITAEVTKLAGWATLLNRAATVAGDFKTSATPWQTPTEMIELYVGWQVYCKVKGLPDTTPVRTNDAIADTTIVAALKAAVDGLDITALQTAWQTVNTALAAPAGGTGTGSGGTGAAAAPTLTAAQVTALQTAMTTAEPTFTALTAKIDAVSTLGANAKNDAALADTAYHLAVDVAVMTNIASNDVLTRSLKAIVSQGVYDELLAANKDF
ncbi:TPA: hypothetical protein JG832_002503 [Enterobacter hormaechei subsp. xiangfangensis]|nr:hypothetical protein [Enterobacter hormaechei subsp. xiangfangensis]HAV1890638.1 hypothetical protein [Enterobacter hormaechei subsp. xiangfangensis]